MLSINRNDPLGLCKYKNIFGKIPHTPRFLNIGVLDVLTTFVFIFLFSFLTKYPFWKSLAFAFFLMLFVHRIFCVRSVSDRFFFPMENNDARFPFYIVVFGFICFHFVVDFMKNQNQYNTKM